MKRILPGTIALLVLAGGAPGLAADIPAPVYKAPVVAPPLAYSWTGFYVGANGGYSWGRGNTDFNETTTFTTSAQVFRTASQTPVGAPVLGTLPAVTAAGSGPANINGWLGGLQAGYNWQSKNLVLGLEADVQITGERGDTTICLVAGCPTGSIIGTASYKLPWFATFRGRVGVAWDRVLFYATGGLALAEVDAGYSGGLVGGPMSSASVSPTRFGYVVGAGVEGAIANNWSLKIEYLFMDLGSFGTNFAGFTNVTTSNALNTPTIDFNTVTTTTATTSGNFNSRVTDSILRVGLNYRFGAVESAVSTKY